MERSRDHEDIATALAEMRPATRSEFAAELDEWVAAGFPRPSHAGRSPFATLAARLRGLAPQRLALTSGAAAVIAIVIATAVIASSGSEPKSGPVALSRHNTKPATGVQYSDTVPKAASETSAVGSTSGGLARLSRPLHREIERSAEIGLFADPVDVADDSARVFSAVHDARGIVLHSTSTAGRNAGAHFDLLIPSARLGDALAAFSAIDEVRTRHEATTDITKPTVSLEEMLRDSRAKVDGLLSRLAAAENESERESVEIGLRHERHHAAVLGARLSKLRDRADFSRVSLRIETDPSATTSGGAWGIDDAFHDAGHILAIAAGVTLIGLAVLAPLALLGLLAWLARRTWLRHARNRALA